MSNRTYKTAAGKTIDMGSLQIKYEKTPAIGNMRVNARGDELTPDGRIVRRKEDVISEKYYELHTMIPQEDAIVESSKPSTSNKNKAYKNKLEADLNPVKETPAIIKDESNEAVETATQEDTTETQSQPSLSASVAKTQSSKGTQEVKSDRQRKRSISGVKRV